MDVRRIIGRLYPAAMKYEVGNGGVPVFTQADICAAIAMAAQADRFATEVWCAVWYESSKADGLIRHRQCEEYLRRVQAVEIGRLAAHIAESEAEDHAGVPGVRRALSAARAERDEAEASRWPAYSARYGLIRKTVIADLGSAKVCPTCAGRGHVTSGTLVVNCAHCGGTGRKPASERQRAEALGISRPSLARWQDVYDWTRELCARAEKRGTVLLRQTLGEPKMAA